MSPQEGIRPLFSLTLRSPLLVLAQLPVQGAGVPPQGHMEAEPHGGQAPLQEEHQEDASPKRHIGKPAQGQRAAHKPQVAQQPPPDGPHPQGGRLQLPALREKEGLQNGHRHGDQQHLEHGERGYGALAGQGVEDGLEKDQRQGIDSHMKFHGQAPAVETDKFSHDGPPFYSPSRSRSRGA